VQGRDLWVASLTGTGTALPLARRRKFKVRPGCQGCQGSAAAICMRSDDRRIPPAGACPRRFAPGSTSAQLLDAPHHPPT
jgi:hypothetical protein